MQWNDAGFESMKKVVAQHAVTSVKTAGKLPQVGLFTSESSADSSSDYDLFVQALSNRKVSPRF
jgi:hypothetical protein